MNVVENPVNHQVLDDGEWSSASKDFVPRPQPLEAATGRKTRLCGKELVSGLWVMVQKMRASNVTLGSFMGERLVDNVRSPACLCVDR